jgi:hypothetical protein
MAPGYWRRAGRAVMAGTLLGAGILGVGGRIVMAIIQHQATGTWNFTIGGSLTVVGMGAVSGAAGAALLLLSDVAGRRLMPSSQWPRAILFAVLLLLVTLRGLSGSPAPGRWYFWPLVIVFGATLLAATAGREWRRASVVDQP